MPDRAPTDPNGAEAHQRRPAFVRLVLALASLVVLVAVSASIALVWVPLDRFRPRVEAAASAALGMQVRISGHVRAGLFPAPNAAFEDVRVLDDREEEVGSIRRVGVWLAWLPLLRGKVRIGRLELRRPALTFRRTLADTLDTAALGRLAGALGTLDGGSFALSDGSLRYAGTHAGDTCDVRDIGLSVTGIRLDPGATAASLAGLGFEGQLTCGSIRTRDHAVSALAATVHAGRGVMAFDPVTLDVFGGQLAGALRVDASKRVPAYVLRCTLRHAHLAELLNTSSPGPAAEGEVQFTSELSMQGTRAPELARTSAGVASVRGTNLALLGDDLDLELARPESGRRFDIADAGAVFFAGPLEPIVTRGRGFTSLLRGTGGRTRIRTLVSDWRVDHGVATASDVAFATPENRIALRGGLDLVQGKFADLAVAVVDANGCARLRQTIHGEFSAPRIDRPRTLRPRAATASRRQRRKRRLLVVQPCERFYAGSVPAPG